MKRIAFALIALIAIVGCAAKPEFVGDTKIRRTYPNTPENEAKVPADRRVYFKDIDHARQWGYLDVNEKDSAIGD